MLIKKIKNWNFEFSIDGNSKIRKKMGCGFPNLWQIWVGGENYPHPKPKFPLPKGVGKFIPEYYAIIMVSVTGEQTFDNVWVQGLDRSHKK